jgi:hypothetical protein
MAPLPSENIDAHHVSEWTLRAAVPEDEGCIASMWLRQLCHGQDARAAGLKDAATRGSDAQVAYWEQYQPIITALVRSVDVVVACDPERSTYEPGQPAVIWGWAATHDDIVYGFGIKRRVVREMRDLALDIAEDLLGESLERPMRSVLDLVDLGALRMIPSAWKRERGWASSLRQLSERVIKGDTLYQAIAGYVIDPQRERWLPSSKRAA